MASPDDPGSPDRLDSLSCCKAARRCGETTAMPLCSRAEGATASRTVHVKSVSVLRRSRLIGANQTLTYRWIIPGLISCSGNPIETWSHDIRSTSEHPPHTPAASGGRRHHVDAVLQPAALLDRPLVRAYNSWVYRLAGLALMRRSFCHSTPLPGIPFPAQWSFFRSGWRLKKGWLSTWRNG